MENQFQQMTAETLAAACDLVDEFEAACAEMIIRLHAELADFKSICDFLIKSSCEDQSEIVKLKDQRDELLAVLEEAEYALDYAADMTKPEGLSGCDCPICTASIRIGEVLAGKRRQA